MGYNPQESLENTINTMGTRTLGVHPSLSLDPQALVLGSLLLSRVDLHQRTSWGRTASRCFRASVRCVLDVFFFLLRGGGGGGGGGKMMPNFQTKTTYQVLPSDPFGCFK